MGYPHSWMVFVRENPNLKWMITRGTPIYGNPHMWLKFIVLILLLLLPPQSMDRLDRSCRLIDISLWMVRIRNQEHPHLQKKKKKQSAHPMRHLQDAIFLPVLEFAFREIARRTAHLISLVAWFPYLGIPIPISSGYFHCNPSSIPTISSLYPHQSSLSIYTTF